MTVMIDWLTLRAPCRLDGRLGGGAILALDESGEVEWESVKRKEVQGSHSTIVTVKGGGNGTMGEIEVSGNPAKWLQGHNLFGSGSVRYLAYRMLAGITRELGLTPTMEDRRAWWRGEFELLRVDITRMYDLGEPQRVTKFLAAALAVAHSKYQQASVSKGGTVYIGQHSRRISLKLYDKYGELHARGKGHKLPATIKGEDRERLLQFAYGKLRVELTARTTELQDRGLRDGRAWRRETAERVLDRYLERLEMGDTMRLSEDRSAALPRRLQLVYDSWRNGRDIRAMYSERTFFRYRREMLAYGIDLYKINPRAIEAENRTLFGAPVPMRELLAIGGGVPVPEWARGTEFYCGPRKAA